MQCLYVSVCRYTCTNTCVCLHVWNLCACMHACLVYPHQNLSLCRCISVSGCSVTPAYDRWRWRRSRYGSRREAYLFRHEEEKTRRQEKDTPSLLYGLREKRKISKEERSRTRYVASVWTRNSSLRVCLCMRIQQGCYGICDMLFISLLFIVFTSIYLSI